MQQRVNQHWWHGAKRLPSPNQNERPAAAAITLIVIHNISLPAGEFGGSAIDALFLNQLDISAHPSFSSLAGLRVSSHLLIRRDGAVHQYVSFDRRAWHAGRSCYRGVADCNDFSIGIELEGADHIPYESIQYDRLIEIVSDLLGCYPTLSCEAIVGHQHIAPQRKSDPGPAFDWAGFRQRLHERLGAMADGGWTWQTGTGALQ